MRAQLEKGEDPDVRRESKPSTMVRCSADLIFSDEFPMRALEESRKPRPQVVRLVNGKANGKQGTSPRNYFNPIAKHVVKGTDFKKFIKAQWKPCSKLRAVYGKPPPPITWEFGGLDGLDIRVTGRVEDNHFIQRFGVSWRKPLHNQLD